MHHIKHSNRNNATVAKKHCLSLVLSDRDDGIPGWSGVESFIKAELATKRKRCFTMWETLQTFLCQVLSNDQSCRNAVMQARCRMADLCGYSISSNTSAYCKARNRLTEEVLQSAAKRFGNSLHELIEPAWKWRGYSVALVDGTTVSMADTRDNQDSYPQLTGQKPGLGFPIARLVAVICLATGAVLDLAIGTYKTGEHALFRSLLDSFAPGTLFLCDRHFDSYFMLAGFVKREFHAVIRVKTANRKHRFMRSDELIKWQRPRTKPDWMTKEQFEEFPRSMIVRIVTRKSITLVTTLLDKSTHPKRALLQLYRDRWNVEVDFRAIKCVMQMDVLRCKTPQMVRKEIWMHVLAYNLVRAIMMQAAREHELLPRSISFKATVQAMHAIGTLPDKMIKYDLQRFLFEVIAKHLVGNRPGRWEPKAVKRRPKPHKLLMQPRNIIKQQRRAIA